MNAFFILVHSFTYDGCVLRYDETGKPATKWRKEQHAKWVEEQKEDNMRFGVAVLGGLAPGAAKGAAADGCAIM